MMFSAPSIPREALWDAGLILKKLGAITKEARSQTDPGTRTIGFSARLRAFGNIVDEGTLRQSTAKLRAWNNRVLEAAQSARQLFVEADMANLEFLTSIGRLHKGAVDIDRKIGELEQSWLQFRTCIHRAADDSDSGRYFGVLTELENAKVALEGFIKYRDEIVADVAEKKLRDMLKSKITIPLESPMEFQWT